MVAACVCVCVCKVHITQIDRYTAPQGYNTAQLGRPHPDGQASKGIYRQIQATCQSHPAWSEASAPRPLAPVWRTDFPFSKHPQQWRPLFHLVCVARPRSGHRHQQPHAFAPLSQDQPHIAHPPCVVKQPADSRRPRRSLRSARELRCWPWALLPPQDRCSGRLAGTPSFLGTA